MKKNSDSSLLENIAEDKIAFELQKHDLLVAKPKSDRKGTDLLVFAEMADGVKFCRIQSKGRSLEHSDRSSVQIQVDYVTDGFLCFLYLYYSENLDELYLFLPEDIRQWKENKKGKYVLNFAKSNAREKLSSFLFDANKAQLIKTQISLAETHGEFQKMIYGMLTSTRSIAKIKFDITTN
mgnify:CR=1 FL=1